MGDESLRYRRLSVLAYVVDDLDAHCRIADDLVEIITAAPVDQQSLHPSGPHGRPDGVQALDATPDASVRHRPCPQR